MLPRTIPAFLAAVGAALLVAWFTAAPAGEWRPRGPETSLTPVLGEEPSSPTESGPSSVPSVPLPGVLVKGDAVPAAGLAGNWPSFRGINRDGVSHEEVPLARSWPGGGPEVVWSLKVGRGYGGPVVHRGRVYLLDYDVARKADALRCLSLADGNEIYRRWYSNPIKTQHGYSRTSPAVTDKYVVTLGPSCHVMCLDADSGEYRWGMDLVARYGATVPEWYAGQCPLIDAGRAIIAPGGAALMIAVDCDSGRVLWETPNPRRWKMTHSSIAPMTVDGRKMYVYCASGGVVGVDAATGELLWEDTSWRIDPVNVSSPVPMEGAKVFLSGGYRAGSLMLELTQAGGKFTARQMYRLKHRDFGSEQHTPVLFGGHIYGVDPAGKLACLDPGGKVIWHSGDQQRFGKGYGPYLIADGMLFVLGHDGLLVLAEATPAGYRQLARAQVAGEHSWGPMAIAGGLLLLRDFDTLLCLDVRAK